MNIKVVRVMLVEDSEALRNSQFQLINETDGYVCIAACSTGEEALNIIPHTLPDLILMDIELGENKMTGITATQRIKNQLPNCLVIMQTFAEDDYIIMKSLLAGADGYIIKDASNQEIISAFKKALDGDFPLTPGLAKRILNLFMQIRKEQLDVPIKIKGLEVPKDISLTPIEQRILEIMKDGMPRKLIASKLNMTHENLRYHIKEIYRKIRSANGAS